MKKSFLLLLATGIIHLVLFSQQPAYKNKNPASEPGAKMVGTSWTKPKV